MAVDGLYPTGELLDVRDRGRQAQQAHMFRKEHQRFLPDCPPLGVIYIMDFVVNDPVVTVEALGFVQDLISEYLSGHDQNRRLRV